MGRNSREPPRVNESLLVADVVTIGLQNHLAEVGDSVMKVTARIDKNLHLAFTNDLLKHLFALRAPLAQLMIEIVDDLVDVVEQLIKCGIVFVVVFHVVHYFCSLFSVATQERILVSRSGETNPFTSSSDDSNFRNAPVGSMMATSASAHLGRLLDSSTKFLLSRHEQ